MSFLFDKLFQKQNPELASQMAKRGLIFDRIRHRWIRKPENRANPTTAPSDEDKPLPGWKPRDVPDDPPYEAPPSKWYEQKTSKKLDTKTMGQYGASSKKIKRLKVMWEDVLEMEKWDFQLYGHENLKNSDISYDKWKWSSDPNPRRIHREDRSFIQDAFMSPTMFFWSGPREDGMKEASWQLLNTDHLLSLRVGDSEVAAKLRTDVRNLLTIGGDWSNDKTGKLKKIYVSNRHKLHSLAKKRLTNYSTMEIAKVYKTLSKLPIKDQVPENKLPGKQKESQILEPKFGL